MRRHRPSASRPVLAALAMALLSPAWAGRPLAVDDANTNEVGHGHVEAWAARAPGSTVFTIAPAYAPIDGLDLSIGQARENGSGVNASTLQLKWRITASRDEGCYVGVSAGVTRVSHGGGRVRFGHLLATCNGLAGGSLHANLGQAKASGSAAEGSWGLAYEHPFGVVTPHLEWFGSAGAKPTLQLGLRGEVVAGWQLDGSVGRSGGQALYTLGVHFGF